MTDPTRTPLTLLGRTEEQRTLGALLDRIAAGHGGALSIVGAPGVGKSAVLEWFASEAARRNASVLWATGVEAEADLPWAALSSICLGRADLLEQLPPPQGRALSGALALIDDGSPTDRLAVSLGALGLLSALARERPLAVIIDDLQWVDPESRRALDFLTRRLADDPVLLVAAVRPGVATPSGAVVLSGLGATAMAAILEHQDVRSPRAIEAIVESAGGNPLLALQLAELLDEGERCGSSPLPTNLRLPVEVSDLYQDRLAQLTEPERQAVAVAAADTVGDLSTMQVALGRLGLGLSDLEAAETGGLVLFDSGALRFTHPMARSAVHHGVPGSVWRRAHGALGEAEGPETPRGILHRAAAAVAPDPALAAALSEQADDALHRGAPLAAADRALEAAALAGDDAVRADLLISAARSALIGGDAPRARKLLARAHAASSERAGQLDARRVEVRLAVAGGDVASARHLAAAVDRTHGASDPAGVAELLGEVARPLLVATPLVALSLIDRVWELAEGHDRRSALYAEVLYGCGCFVRGDLQGAARHTGVWPELLRSEGAVAAGPFLAESVVLYQCYSQQVGAALKLLDEIEGEIRRRCASGALVSVLAARSLVSYGLDLQACVAAGREARRLAVETDQPGLSSVATTTLAIATATVGDESLTREVCDELLASGEQVDEIWARAALGRLHLVHGRPESAVDQFARLRARVGSLNESFAQFEADEAEALVRIGRLGEARDLLPGLAASAESQGWWAIGMHERIQALVTDDLAEAMRHFEAARSALARTDNRIAQGIVELTWGERLRRAKRRAEARRRLERAVELFGLVGASGLRRRAEEELSAAGGVIDRTRPTAELLGSTELHAARLAVGGATNRDIATQLFLSPRTVENHLSSVYRKLGLTGRAALLARADDDEALRSAPRAEALHP